MHRRNASLVTAGLSGPVLALLVATLACGSRHARPSDIHGELRVHTGLQAAPDAGLESVTVILGEGSRFSSPVDDAGDAVFSDPSLTGPQTVSAVEVLSSGEVDVTTVADVGRSELWLPVPPLIPSLGAFRGKVTGYVTGLDPDGYVNVYLPQSDIFLGEAFPPDSGYDLDVETTTDEPVDVFAVEFANSDHRPMRVGMRRGILVRDGGTVSGQDVVLDRALDQPVKMTVEGADAYDATPFNFWTVTDGDSPNSLSIGDSRDGKETTFQVFSLAPPFDGCRLQLSSSTGLRSEGLPTVEAFDQVSYSSPPASVTMHMFPPFSVDSPDLSGGSVSDDFDVSWHASDQAQWVAIRFNQSYGPTYAVRHLRWTVWAPAEDGSFHFFPLPEGPSTPAGGYNLDVTEGYSPIYSRFEDLFGPDAGTPENVELRQARVSGGVKVD